MKAVPREGVFVRQILDGLMADRWFAWRNNSGARVAEYKGKRRFFRFGAKGSPDILAIRKGVALAVEVKRPGGKQSDDQRAWQAEWTANGGVYVLANNYGDVLDAVRSDRRAKQAAAMETAI